MIHGSLVLDKVVQASKYASSSGRYLCAEAEERVLNYGIFSYKSLLNQNQGFSHTNLFSFSVSPARDAGK